MKARSPGPAPWPSPLCRPSGGALRLGDPRDACRRPGQSSLTLLLKLPTGVGRYSGHHTDLSSVLPPDAENRGPVLQSPGRILCPQGRLRNHSLPWGQGMSLGDSSAAGQALGASGSSHSFEVNHSFLVSGRAVGGREFWFSPDSLAPCAWLLPHLGVGNGVLCFIFSFPSRC